MKTIWDAAARDEIGARLSRLEADERGRWGKFTAPQMVTHLIAATRMALGDLHVPSKNLPLRYPPLKQLIIYVLPFPKGAPTAPQLLAVPPAEWQTDVETLRTLVGRFATADVNAEWPEHPAFGHLSGKAWGVLVYRHTDHHLRQFGV